LGTRFKICYVALVIEWGAVFVVAFGALRAITSLLKAIATGPAREIQDRLIWLRFATWILLALEFALAAGILRTAVAPTWDDISKLAVIATIRTMLNYSWRRTSQPSIRAAPRARPPSRARRSAGFRPINQLD
jgi:uncharacterized membrane protein